jgi:HEAT repeat protein
VAVFEAFGQIGDEDSVLFLDKILNGRGWLNRGESTEMRACAALALGKVRHRSALDALSKAASDSDPVVRSAVARAMRGDAE